MENRDLLEKIHRDNKAINRNIQSLINIGLIGLMGEIGQDPLLFVGDIVDYRKEKRLL